MLTTIHQRIGHWKSLGLAWLLFLVVFVFYWVRLSASHHNHLLQAELQAELRASQTAHALSMQMHSQLLSIDFVMNHLIEHWLEHDQTVFRKLIDLAQHGIFKGALDVIAVTDAEGHLLFDSTTPIGQSLPKLSAAKRDYFQALAQEGKPRFFISAPIQNMITQRWTIQFSHSMFVDGKFAGIIIASVPAEHLSDAFKQVFPSQDDVVFLTLNDGSYLARTHALDTALTQKAFIEREFIQHKDKSSGTYTVVSPIDDVERIYAWQRIPGFPVALSLGLSKKNVLAPVRLANKESTAQNLLGAILLLLAALWITRLVCIQTLQNRALLQTKMRVGTLLKRVPAGVLLIDENNIIVRANAQLCSLLNLDVDPQSLIGIHHEAFISMLNDEQTTWFPLASNGLIDSHFNEVSDSSGLSLKIDWVPIQYNQNSLGGAWFAQDISDTKQKEQELLTLATTDALTGLHNRRSFLDMLQHQLKYSQVNLPGVLLTLDIDHFKHVNDTYGHPVGDLVLQNVAQIMRDTLRQSDISARVGGEEFSVLLPKATLPQALQLAERIRERISATPTVTEADTIYVTISIGAALLYGHDEKSVQEHADQALYQAKNSGRNRVCYMELPAPSSTAE